ncbi:MAG TPA: type II toxin-antitoxin system PrlF family antitoxin [Candidatus Acidoferrales bacterium]
MPKATVKKRSSPTIGDTHYRGKQAKTGNSLGFRFDRALFKSHPEFNGEVSAQVIAPGRLLVSAEKVAKAEQGEDQVVGAFLAFLAKDMKRRPEMIKPVDPGLMKTIAELVKDVDVRPDEDLGDEALI